MISSNSQITATDSTTYIYHMTISINLQFTKNTPISQTGKSLVKVKVNGQGQLSMLTQLVKCSSLTHRILPELEKS